MTKRRAPRIGERVFADGLNGEFTVITVDEKQGVVDLELTTGTHFIEKHIPFGAIHRVREDVNQAAARVVREATHSLIDDKKL
jgi:hypothetical protein